ncbi:MULTISPECIES: tetratricopeptide repeat protein [unclassified Lentimicrobium]|uniref:tetratricopeptide repeat protein n=1 Tax=unclassified Lentimicrobium TaxID=2677434 RepID=UPI0015538C60|nr:MULTISPECIES: hypothetical protein [unclassified Lentimicrobium]NPD45185.1 hypothetical protein [Lentimicrobium sp. S6]NPD84482.1 hypothetical protein [Lentimicrobium sp. L6]
MKKTILLISLFFTLASCQTGMRADLILLENGKELFFQAQYQKALIPLQKSARINPRNDVAIAYLGYCQYYLDDWSTALIYFNQSLKLNTRNNIALFGKSLILWNMDDRLNAYLIFDSVGKINPNHDKVFYYKAQAELYFGDTLSSEKSLKKAINNAQDYSEPYYLLASIYFKKGLHSKADSIIRIASSKKEKLLKQT